MALYEEELSPPEYLVSRPKPAPLVRDSFGSDLLRAHAEYEAVEASTTETTQAIEYWSGVKDQYFVSDWDAENLTLNEIAKKHRLSEAARHYIAHRNIGLFTLDAQIEDGEFNLSLDKPAAKRGEMLEEFDKIRTKLGKMLVRPQHKTILEDYVNPRVPDVFDEMRLQSNEGMSPWDEWLAETATLDQFMKFMRWHNAEMYRTNNSPEVADAIAEQRGQYEAAFREFIKRGDLPAGSFDSDELYDCQVIVGDVFSTLMDFCGGYCPIGHNTVRPNDKYIVVDKDHVKISTKHELNHVLLPGFNNLWLNEATTEHLALSMENGQVLPILQYIKQGVYEPERYLLDMVMSYCGNISTTTLLHGYAGVTNEFGGNVFTAAVDEAWGYTDAAGAIQTEIDCRTAENLKTINDPDPYDIREAQEKAINDVNRDLWKDPQSIFGDNYELPPTQPVSALVI